MKMPVLNGVIDRRLLINYRADPDVVKGLLPPKLEPWVVNGYASAGICLLRLKNIGIKYSPRPFRITSENAAHRFLVKYVEDGREKRGVYIPRRDTDSWLNVTLGGGLLSWPHYAASFRSIEGEGRFSVSMESSDKFCRVEVETTKTTSFPKDSMFDSMDHASACFEECQVGISPSNRPGRFLSIRLKTNGWSVSALKVHALHSSYFSDQSIFPNGSVQLDHALLMEGIAHEWFPC